MNSEAFRFLEDINWCRQSRNYNIQMCVAVNQLIQFTFKIKILIDFNKFKNIIKIRAK